MNIWDLEKEQRDALIFWIRDMESKTPITICDPHNYLTGKDGLSMDNIPQETRRDSFAAVKPDAAARRRVILEILAESDGMTAREVAGELHRRGITPTDERNYAAPRLTELYKAGKITATGKRKCPQTGRSVAVWAAGKG
jgi:hypothetical protein